MRLWSIDPRQLDAKGLVALWREALLAKHVLLGKTKGYRHHPQLIRFRQSSRPVHSINQYLAAVYDAAMERGYHFDRKKINWRFKPSKLTVTRGQVEYELQHLLKKLKRRDRKQYHLVAKTGRVKPHPMFRVVKGNVEDWEVR